MPRKTNEERIAAARERYIKLEAAERARQILTANASREKERKLRAQALAELGAALLAWMRLTKTETWVQDILASKKGLRAGLERATDKQRRRREEAIRWLCGQLGLEYQPPAAPAPQQPIQQTVQQPMQLHERLLQNQT